MTATPDPVQPSEHALMERVRAGDRAALGRLVTRYWSRLKMWALWEAGDTSLADDACQEAWIRLARAAATLDPERPVAGWLRTVVRNVCRDLRAREVRATRPVPLPARWEEPVDRSLDVRRGAERMLAAFARLTPRQREALDWVDRQGLNATEAAEKMQAKPATVRALLHQGRRALREELVASELHDLVRER